MNPTLGWKRHLPTALLSLILLAASVLVAAAFQSPADRCPTRLGFPFAFYVQCYGPPPADLGSGLRPAVIDIAGLLGDLLVWGLVAILIPAVFRRRAPEVRWSGD